MSSRTADSPPPRSPHRWLWARRFLLAGIAIAALNLVFLVRQWQPARVSVRMTAGSFLGRRTEIARVLAREGRGRGLDITLRETEGSETALRSVAAGTLDAALVQGGSDLLITSGEIVQVASLVVEPLHLLVRPKLAAKGLSGLKGRRINLSTRGSGTRRLALEALAFAGLEPGRDFQDVDLDYKQLETLPPEQLPDALFSVSLMPSPVVEFLVKRRGYQLAAIPFADALHLRNSSVHPAKIPAYTYSAEPPVPPRDLPTVGNRLQLVARTGLPAEAVRRLLETLYSGDFGNRVNLPDLDEREIEHSPERPLHAAALAFARRNEPFVTASAVQSLESLRSFLFSVAVGLYFLWRWSLKRRYAGFDLYLAEVTRIERSALRLELAPTLDVRALIDIRNRLSEIKTEALEKFTRGELRGEELMSSFLTHVSDVRSYLTALILAERERIATTTADSAPDADQEERFRAVWGAALGDAALPATDSRDDGAIFNG